MRHNLQSLLMAVALTSTTALAGPAVVGVATAVGSFSVNNTAVSGTANLTDGAQLKTTGTTGQVMLKSGSSALFATNSAATIYGSKVVLLRGMARFDNLKPGFQVDAASLRIENDQAGGQGAVRLNGNKVEVASVIGNMNVYNAQGALLTRVAAGTVVGVDDPDAGGGSGGQSGASSGGSQPIMSNTAALWIAGGLLGLGLGLGLGISQSGSSSTSP
jgi:hypothetical protein